MGTMDYRTGQCSAPSLQLLPSRCFTDFTKSSRNTLTRHCSMNVECFSCIFTAKAQAEPRSRMQVHTYSGQSKLSTYPRCVSLMKERFRQPSFSYGGIILRKIKIGREAERHTPSAR